MNESVVILFSDVIIQKDLIEKCILSSDDYNLLIHDKTITSKTMRVKIEKEGIVDIGSHIPKNEGDANFIGIAKYSGSGARVLKDTILKLCANKKHIDDYYTIALTAIAKTGEKIRYTINTENYYWNEIDYYDDYIEVQKTLKENSLFGIINKDSDA